ncbi:spore germination protein GerPE [Peribacillus cavernae]|uniref:Spore germination protein GerPE n=1 Tax=Peribacillus cavernae TaxID=1674310 RepID=A0A433HNX6_9BACI|nr:spore germination protein GerPE [Peribacillus cavernae]MDQ0217573.1 spore germination protein PE [Peribacillus cavernae]RUQ29993.1 spore germination protein GerPE [Peribacillus cavernae]
MFSRISRVKSFSSQTLSFSSTLQIGDCTYIDGHSETFAVQREAELFWGNEADVLPYPIFYSPSVFLPVAEDVKTTFINNHPFIETGNVNIVGISASSVIAVGNIRHARMRSRVKHIRQLLDRQVDNNSKTVSSNGKRE